MTPEQLVPPLELCQRAQKLGWERETHFVWMQFPTYLDGLPTGRYVYHVEQHSSHPMYPTIPAPTLQELLEDIFASGYRVPAVYSAEAAALLWLELHKEGVA